MMEVNVPEILPQGKIEGVLFRPLKRFDDQRGWLMELFRQDEVIPEYHPVMAYISETSPGVSRGPHEHQQQTDLFAFLGPGDFRLYLWDARSHSPTFGNHITVVVGASNPGTVLIPPGIVHAYQNISTVSGIVLNFPNRLYRGVGKQEPIDEIRHEEDSDSPYQLTSLSPHLKKAG